MNLQITELIRTQTFDCLIMFSCGTFLALVYCIGSFIKRQLHPKKFWSIALELVFWVAAAVIAGEFLYYCAYGKWSLHSFAALFLGGVLSKKFFYKVKYDIISPNWIKQKTPSHKVRTREKNGKKKKKSRI